MKLRKLHLASLLILLSAAIVWAETYPGNCNGQSPCANPQAGYQKRYVSNLTSSVSYALTGALCRGSTGFSMHESANPNDRVEVSAQTVAEATGPTQMQNPDITQSTYGNASAASQCAGDPTDCVVGDVRQSAGLMEPASSGTLNPDNLGYITTPTKLFDNSIPAFGGVCFYKSHQPNIHGWRSCRFHQPFRQQTGFLHGA
jgi:hypothetical protein